MLPDHRSRTGLHHERLTTTPTPPAADEPTYRVGLFRRIAGAKDWAAEHYRVTGALDVRDVLNWAARHPRADRFTVDLEAPTSSGATLVRLVGDLPNP